MHRMIFEGIRMKEDESVVAYILRVDEVVSALKGLGAKDHCSKYSTHTLSRKNSSKLEHHPP